MPSTKLLMISGVTILSLLIAGYVLLAALNRPTGQLLDFILILIGQASGTALIIVKQMYTENKLEAVKEQVSRVEERTNGHMTTLIDAAIHAPAVESEGKR